jgi:membrane protease YdiL (CAAX protease family)
LPLFLFPLILIADQYSFEVSIPIQAGLIIIVTGICQALRRKPLTEITGILNLRWVNQFLIGLAIGAILMILPALVLTVFGLVHWQVNDFSYSTILTGVTIFAGVALAEELLFRGFIFQRFIQSTGPWPAQLIIAGMFLLTHLNNPGMTGVTKTLASINIFIASILFGLAFIKTKSLAMPLGLHFMANLMQGTVLGFGVSGEQEASLFAPIVDQTPFWLTGGSFGLEASLPGLLTLLLITMGVYRWKTES